MSEDKEEYDIYQDHVDAEEERKRNLKSGYLDELEKQKAKEKEAARKRQQK